LLAQDPDRDEAVVPSATRSLSLVSSTKTLSPDRVRVCRTTSTLLDV
jgi:hypothetical protein